MKPDYRLNGAMMASLIHKESHHLKPLVLILIALELWGMGSALISSSPDQVSWMEYSILYNQSYSGYGILFWLIGLIGGYLILAPDRDQGTLAFLHSLPIKRIHLFAAKVLTVFLVLTLVTALSQILTGCLQLMGQNSLLQAQFTLALWLRELGLMIMIQAMGISLGVLVAYFRLPGIITLGVVWIALSIATAVMPSMNILLPQSLLQTEPQGTELILPMRAWMLQFAFSLISLLIAARLWSKHSDVSAKTQSKSNVWPGLIKVAVYSLIGCGIIVFSASQLLTDKLYDNNDSAEHSVLKTGYFELNYLAKDQGQVELLYLEVDDFAAQIAQLLNAPISKRILVDLTQDAHYHLGIAGWQRMKINRSSLTDPSERQHVFVHEASHVIASSLSDRRLKDHFNYTKFFNEGMAEWVSYELLGLNVQRQALEQLAATAWHRFDLSFSDILYFTRFSAQYDENLIYAIGLVWVDSLAKTCGKDAPGLAIKAMGRPDMSQRLRGRQFWRSVLQQNQCSLEEVNARLETTMKALSPLAASVPRFSTAIRQTDEIISFAIRLKALDDSNNDQAYSVTIRIREDINTPLADVVIRHGRLSGSQTWDIELPRTAIEGDSYQYQLGIEFVEDQRPFFSPWQTEFFPQ